MKIKQLINPAKIGVILGAISIYLALQSLFNEYLIEYFLSSDTNSTAILVLDLFSVNVEESIPTWFATLLLFTAASFLGVIAKGKWALEDRFKYYWAGLAFVFVYLSIDEGAAIHEIVVDPLQEIFNTTGYLAFAWQLAAVPLVIIFALLYIPFIFHLPLRWRYLFVASGVIYVTGTLIFEAISANRWYLDGDITFPYLAIATIEELFEMLGVVLFIYTLSSYMAANQYTLSLTYSSLVDIEETAPETPSSPSNHNANPKTWKWLFAPLICLVLFVNGVTFFWAQSEQTARAATVSGPEPFYLEIIDQYSGQGVVVLRLNGTFTPENPATEQIATSLLVLFDDVIIVSLPKDNFSIAFASAILPFDKEDLGTILQTQGTEDFLMLNTREIRTFAKSGN